MAAVCLHTACLCKTLHVYGMSAAHQVYPVGWCQCLSLTCLSFPFAWIPHTQSRHVFYAGVKAIVGRAVWHLLVCFHWVLLDWPCGHVRVCSMYVHTQHGQYLDV